MTPEDGPTRRDWLTGTMLGAGVGALVLGVGGRVSMRGIALAAGQPPTLSLGGTITVILLGAVCGLVGGLVFVGLRFLIRRRPLLRATLFWAFLVLITWRGLNPVDAQRLMLFMPLVILYGATLHLLWWRGHSHRLLKEGDPL